MKKLSFLFVLFLIAATPFYGYAVVDGETGDWSLTEDIFAEMYEGGNLEKEILSKVYLRYDCYTETMYTLVVAEDGFTVEQVPEENYVKIDNAVVDFLEFEYLVSAEGWEASFSLPEGDYKLDVHTLIFDDRTSALENRELDLEIKCTPTVVSLSSFGAVSSNSTEMVLSSVITTMLIMLVVVGFSGFVLWRLRNLK